MIVFGPRLHAERLPALLPEVLPPSRESLVELGSEVGILLKNGPEFLIKALAMRHVVDPIFGVKHIDRHAGLFARYERGVLVDGERKTLDGSGWEGVAPGDGGLNGRLVDAFGAAGTWSWTLWQRRRWHCAGGTRRRGRERHC
ncbi:MAG: hypothetical protein AAF565_12725 [Pseudomonadota bacterium]